MIQVFQLKIHFVKNNLRQVCDVIQSHFVFVSVNNLLPFCKNEYALQDF